MPKVVEKRRILNGRGSVVLYGSGSSAGQFFYREIIKGTKNYKTRKIEGVSDIEEAASAAVEIAFSLANEPEGYLQRIQRQDGVKSNTESSFYSANPRRRRPRKELIEDSFNKWFAVEQRRVDAGLITQFYLNARKNGLSNHILKYLNSKMVLYTSDINSNTFSEYPVYRSKTTPIVRNQELKWVKEWCSNYLVKNQLMDASLLLDRTFLPFGIVKQTDLMKNPAITAADWNIIISFVRDEWRFRPLSQDNKCGWFFRNMFWHYLLFAKNTGMSPEEIIKMKWKQIEIVDVGRLDSKGNKVSWEVSYINTIRSKTQRAREIPANQARELRRWKKWVQEYIEKKNLSVKITRDTLVFGQPDFYWKPFSYKHFGEMWREIRNELKDKLEGHRFSEHPYTMYSLRSTFIEDHLLKGTPVMEVAEMAGHSVVETQKTYARLNLRKKGREITMPKLGRRIVSDGEVVNLFADDAD